MVQTRNQWNAWANRGFRNTQSSQGSSRHSQMSFNMSQHSNDDHNMDEPNADRNLYAPNDHCKRHRKEDGEPKTEEVRTYRRRIPA